MKKTVFFLVVALLSFGQCHGSVDCLSNERPTPSAPSAPQETDISSTSNPLPKMQEDLEKYFLRTTAYSGARFLEARKLLIAQHKNALRRALGTVNPVRWGKEVHRAYVQHEFLSTSYGKHANQRMAISSSIKSAPLGDNIKASLKGWRHPASYAGYLLAPLVLEGHRQLKYEGKIDGKKLKETMAPLPIAGAIGGAAMGDMAGATVQSALGSFGPLGHLAGFVARPVISFTGYFIGNNFGKSVQQGKPSLNKAIADTMYQMNPLQFTTAVACGSVGGVLGQALIPIPVIGYIAGYALGGTLGTSIGTALGEHGPTGKWNKLMTTWMKKQADRLTARRESRN